MEGEMTMQPAAVGRGLAHTLKDDVYGMILGVMFIAVGLNLLKCAGMITGGIAGIARCCEGHFVAASAMTTAAFAGQVDRFHKAGQA